MRGSGTTAGALRLFIDTEEVTYVKAKLREVDYVFHIPTAAGDDWHQVTIQAGLLDGRLNLTFCIAGEAQVSLPEKLVEGIRQALDYARKHTRAQDLREKDPPEGIE